MDLTTLPHLPMIGGPGNPRVHEVGQLRHQQGQDTASWVSLPEGVGTLLARWARVPHFLVIPRWNQSQSWHSYPNPSVKKGSDNKEEAGQLKIKGCRPKAGKNGNSGVLQDPAPLILLLSREH